MWGWDAGVCLSIHFFSRLLPDLHKILVCGRLYYHLQNLQHLLLLLQWHWVSLAPPVVQAVRCKTVQLVPVHLDLTQGPRHTDLTNDGVEDVAQICSLNFDLARLENLRDNRIADQEFSYASLALAVRIVRCVELAHGREQDAACFAVADAQRAELGLTMSAMCIKVEGFHIPSGDSYRNVPGVQYRG